MKTLFLVPIIALLFGCGVLPQRYDNNEYEIWVRMLVSAQELKTDCETASITAIDNRLASMYTETQVAKIYANYTPDNPEVSTAANIIANDIVEMRKFYRKNEHNVTYCKRKASLIEAKIDTFAKTIPERNR